jgi:cytochrome c oxidase accessory protein FixG
MCPWPRIQAALIDEHALNVTYRYDRGEPPGSVKKNETLRLHGLPAGDCIDCLQCVVVCPTGVDIRNGPNLGCIQCGLCIDACDAVMAKVGHPTRLIAYDTDLNIKRRQTGQPAIFQIVRARTVLYAAIIALVGGVMAYALATRSLEGVSVIHDRNPMLFGCPIARCAMPIRFASSTSASRRVNSRSGSADCRPPSSTSSACRRAPTAVW